MPSTTGRTTFTIANLVFVNVTEKSPMYLPGDPAQKTFIYFFFFDAALRPQPKPTLTTAVCIGFWIASTLPQQTSAFLAAC